MKKLMSFALALSMLMSVFAIPASAATAPQEISQKTVHTQTFTVVTDGYVENFYINENREVFVNGRNITTFTQKPNANSMGLMAKSGS